MSINEQKKISSNEHNRKLRWFINWLCWSAVIFSPALIVLIMKEVVL